MKLEIKNITKTYGKETKALQDVSLTIEKGMFGLLGQNGAGKSTLMRTIATLQNPDSGDIFFNDIDVLSQPMQLRKKLGYLPQEFGIYPSVTAEELLLHIANMKGIESKSDRKNQVTELLHRVNLYEHRNKKLGGYSGGMKQRFGIAQTLVGNPELIIVDEPTAGLDPMERNRFYNLLAELGEDKVVILSTHIVEDVSTLCNDMAIIGNGEVLLVGKPNEIQDSLKGKIYQATIERKELENYKEKYNVLAQHFYAGKMIVTIYSDKNISNKIISTKEPSLEDAYFNLLRQETV